MSTGRAIAALVAVGLALIPAEAALAFATYEGEEAKAELRGNVRWGAIAGEPIQGELFPGFSSHTTFLRGIGELSYGERVSFDLHALQILVGSTAPVVAGAVLERTGERNRTAALRWSQTELPNPQAVLEVDRASVHLALAPFDLRVGRQAINLATSAFFTPNDFFAPFAAQTFYRLYKPGVDAARLDVELGQFSGLSLIGVLGYDHVGRLHAVDPIDLDASSLLARGVTTVADLEVSMLLGRVAGSNLVGGGVQGELFGWLGVRGEGHVKLDDTPTLELALGVERRFESSLFLRLEHFYHGGGASSPEGYFALAFGGAGDIPYLGRQYTGFGAGYQLTPLLSGDALFLMNWADPSALLSVYFVYSLLDEAEVALSGSVPLGAGPVGFTPRSEFGLYPATVNVELRVFF